VTLGGFGESSTIHWSPTPGNNGKSVVLPRGPASSGGCVTQEVLISAPLSGSSSKLRGVRPGFGVVRNAVCAVFEIARADLKDRPQFKTILGVTPAPLVAAFAALAWPPTEQHTDQECACTHALLREFGRVVPAFTLESSLESNSWQTERSTFNNGLEEVFVLEGETPGQLSRDAQARGLSDVVVPPGVAEGREYSINTLYVGMVALVVQLIVECDANCCIFARCF